MRHLTVLTCLVLAVCITSIAADDINSKKSARGFLEECPKFRRLMYQECSKSVHSCRNKCGTTLISDPAGPLTCSCDEACIAYHDCCHDFRAMCPHLLTGNGKYRVTNNYLSICDWQDGFRYLAGCLGQDGSKTRVEANHAFDTRVTSQVTNLNYADQQSYSCVEAYNSNFTRWSKVMKLTTAPDAITMEKMVNVFDSQNVYGELPQGIKPRLCHWVVTLHMTCPNVKRTCKRFGTVNLTAVCELMLYDENIRETVEEKEIVDDSEITTVMDVSSLGWQAAGRTTEEMNSTNDATTKQPMVVDDVSSLSTNVPSQTTSPPLDAVLLTGQPESICMASLILDESAMASPVSQRTNRLQLLTYNADDTSEERFFIFSGESQVHIPDWLWLECRTVTVSTWQSDGPPAFSHGNKRPPLIPMHSRNLWSCKILQCSASRYYLAGKCRQPRLLQVGYVVPSAMSYRDAKEVEIAINNAININYHTDTDGSDCMMVNNETDVDNVILTSEVKDDLSRDQDRVLPITRHLSSLLMSSAQKYRFSDFTVCLGFGPVPISLNEAKANGRCDTVSAAGMYSLVGDFPISTDRLPPSEYLKCHQQSKLCPTNSQPKEHGAVCRDGQCSDENEKAEGSDLGVHRSNIPNEKCTGIACPPDSNGKSLPTPEDCADDNACLFHGNLVTSSDLRNENGPVETKSDSNENTGAFVCKEGAVCDVGDSSSSERNHSPQMTSHSGGHKTALVGPLLTSPLLVMCFAMQLLSGLE